MTQYSGPHFRSMWLYARREDFLLLFERVDAVADLTYIDGGPYHVPFRKLFAKDEESVWTYEKGAMIPNIGIASGRDANFCSTVLVAEPGYTVRTLPRRPEGLKTYFEVRQSHNLDMMEITLGGLRGEDTLLPSSLTIESDSALARRIMSRFRKVIKQEFVKVRGNYVGPAALQMLRSGKRLTSAVQSPPEYDLVEEE